MKVPSPVLEALARRYERSQAGRTGEAKRDVFVERDALFKDAGAVEGDAHELAMNQLRAAAQAGIVELIPLHKRDPLSLHKVRFIPANEERLYEWLGSQSPAAIRAAVAKQFAAAASHPVPEQWTKAWANWCGRMQAAALAGNLPKEFERLPSQENAEILALLPKLLGWKGEFLVRFASCELCGNSKRLETLATRETEGDFRDQLRGRLGRILGEITGGEICALDDLGITANPRSVLVHGPLRLCLDGAWVDLGLLQGSFRLSKQDIDRAEPIKTTASRCLTVENETNFHELARLQSGVLLIQTSFPGAGILALLRRLPEEMEYWHFGDIDKPGFAILESLKKKSERAFQPLHMTPGRPLFEQESLGLPRPSWPFY